MAEKKQRKVIQVEIHLNRVVYLFDDGSVATATLYGDTMGILIDITPEK